MTVDSLSTATWTCASTAPGLIDGPDELAGATLDWLPATVPGTAAAALRAAGRWQWGRDDEAVLDDRDWWFVGRLEGELDGSLELDGLATLADVWLDGQHLLSSTNMFVAHRVEVTAPKAQHELVLRFAALSPHFRRRHPRPRWKSKLVRYQTQRWYRTTLLGRMPGWSRWAAPVGPWRPIRFVPNGEHPRLTSCRLTTRCAGAGGTVAVEASLRCATPPQSVRLVVGDTAAPLSTSERGDEIVVSGDVALDAVDRWWPHTHGEPVRYQARLEVDGAIVALRPVAFRTIDTERGDGGFELRVNGEPIFARGACWGPQDAIGFNATAGTVRAAVALACETGLNVLRIGGYLTYEESAFWDACDELGMLVWQDVMIASFDPPDDDRFRELMRPELEQVLTAIGDRPSLAVVCGSSESHQQAAMYGLDASRWQSPMLDAWIPSLVATLAPGIPYVPSSPSGSDRPFGSGDVSHYFGVGAYLRPLTDARMAGVRFAAECLSFGNPPERETVLEEFGSVIPAAHDPRWKAAVARDQGTPWDFEDVREHYVGELFKTDSRALRVVDPEHALDLGRAAVCEIVEQVIGHWRRRGSSCAGAIVLCWRDLWPGAGWGFVDAAGRPKAPLHALRRASAPTTVHVADDGLDGLRLVVHHDRPDPVRVRVELRVYRLGGDLLDHGERDLVLEGRSSTEISADSLLGGFRDLNNAYRFSPPTADIVHARLLDADGVALAHAHFLPQGPARARVDSVGLRCELAQDEQGWRVVLATDQFAQRVSFDVPGYRAKDSWMHIEPGGRRDVRLVAQPGAPARPAGVVRALNSAEESALV